MLYAVTVKLPKNPEHDPHNKQTGACPAGDGESVCTDVTGEHHTILITADDQDHAKFLVRNYKHVTRIEEVFLFNGALPSV
ncbi:MAG TPA: hypothetical protein VIY48_04010 [Candidatus Paceibacterota bacterium]